MQDRYVFCYLSGRMEPVEREIDIEKIVDRIAGGAPMRETTLELARSAAMADMDSAMKIQWLHDNIDTIRRFGGDTEKAWRMFCQGRVDALAWQLEEAVVDELVNREEGDDEDEADEGDDDEGDDDEGDDDEGADEDDEGAADEDEGDEDEDEDED